MYNVNENNDSISIKFSSEVRLVDRIIKESGEFFQRFNLTRTENLKIILRELIINAIEHGNRDDIKLTVLCEIEVLPDGKIKVIVTDQGEGFDTSNINYQMPENEQQYRSRGLPLINALADTLIYNTRGNQATAIFTPLPETDFVVHEVMDTAVIIPSGDITASSVEKLRVILLELLDKGMKDFTFDFRSVEDIDSISLSVLITFSKMAFRKAPNAVLKITNAKKDVINLIELTRLNRIYRVG